MSEPVRVYIVDDHRMIAEGISTLLKDEESVTIAGYATTAEACTAYLKNNTVDIIFMDINLPDMDGALLCKKVTNAYPGIKVIALTTISQGSYITTMMENGASGYLLKNADKNELVEAIHSVSAGKQYFSFETGKLYRATIEEKSRLPQLTKREKEILKLIADGMSNSQMAEKLFISIDTVDTHRKNLYAKLGVTNIAGLVRFALKNDL